MAMEFEDPSFMSDEEVALIFGDDGGNGNNGGTQEPPKDDNPEDDPSKQKPAEESSEEIDFEALTGVAEHEENHDDPEGVGSKKEDKQGKQGDAPSNESNPPVFSSLAKALKKDGILPDLADEDVDKVQDAESFSEMINNLVQSRLDERQKRIDAALNNGVEPSEIAKYEQTIHQLESITEEQVSAEGEQGENLRKNILYRDYINKGFTKERAIRAVNQAVNEGTDIEDAKEALESIKENVRAEYQAKLDEAAAEEEAVKQQQADQAKELRKSLMEGEDLFGDLEVDKATRQKALDAIIKPTHQDPETGRQYTAIQMYEKENRVDFLKKIGLIYAMTDGFKSLEGLIGKKVKKEVGKGMKDLEDVLNNTRRKDDGSIDYTAGTTDDPDSFLGSGYTLDLSNK